MKHHLKRMLQHTTRILSLVVLAALGTIALMRSSPGYFSDIRELDPVYADAARVQLSVQQTQQGKPLNQAVTLLLGCLRGDFGRSRQFDVPVIELIESRITITTRLLLFAVGGGWLIAVSLALPLGLRRRMHGESMIAGITVVSLAVPVGAMATACFLAGCGGPIAVLAALIAIRDFRLLYRLIRQSRMSPHLNYARAQGIARSRIAWIYLLAPLSRELLAIGVLSLLTALSAIVPVEVVFDVPGLGQLAWSAAMNRDLPVLLGVTLVMASAVGLLTITTKFQASEVAL